MANKMLIDASHPEETRVVVLRDQRVEEFDFEAASKKPLRGNIYLAKVTRVEPSLQAAFIDYGGNRHGFLAFSEIHPDYYQIPVADRQALLADVAAAAAAEEEEEERRPRRTRRHRSRGPVRTARARAQDETLAFAPQDADAPAANASEADDGQPIESQLRSSAPLSHDGLTEPGLEHEAKTQVLGYRGDRDEAIAIDPAQGLEADLVDGAAHAYAQEDRASSAQKSGIFDDGRSPTVGDSDAQLEFYRDRHDMEEAIAAAPSLDASDEGDAESNIHHGGDGSGVDGQDYEARGFEDEDEEGEEGEEDEDAEDGEEDEDEEDAEEDEGVEQIGGDALEEMPIRKPRTRRQYKIQEVIKRRQVLLVQVVKEERGNKGAALTTFLSLAGRYSVLMPNTARGGGISRKITDAGDRKRLKEIAQELDVPEGMGVILRTAGAARTRAEVKRDFEYLLRMWETVREATLRSSAPTLVYEEGSLIKRAIRDLYNKDIDEVIVSGDEGFREARDFMRLLTPSHVRNVKPWREQEGLFVRAGVETQLDSMFSPQVTLRSGGYLVINQTEALVAIDVNSGRSTREHNIEDTAVRTNLEAADEVARQLRLRDLAGLIVVDFIDMDEPRNNRAVERRLKDALKNDRARIQVGRISHFGLLEMSRQRIRAGLVEGSTTPCPHCSGSGSVRSVSSIALHVLRVLEETLNRCATHNIIVRTRAHVAFYILNQKRDHLRDIEERYGVEVFVLADDTLTGSSYHALERGEPALGAPKPRREPPARAPEIEYEALETDDDSDDAADEMVEQEQEAQSARRASAGEDDEDSENGRRRRRRRRRRPPARGDKEENSANGVGRYAARQRQTRGGKADPDLFENADAQWSEPGQGQWTREDNELAQPFAAPLAILPLPQERNLGSSEIFESMDSHPRSEEATPRPIEAESENQARPDESHETSQTVLAASREHFEPVASTPAAQDSSPTAPREDFVAHQEPMPAPSKPYEKVITEADPEAPKKGGWWQRAKASLTGQ